MARADGHGPPLSTHHRMPRRAVVCARWRMCGGACAVAAVAHVRWRMCGGACAVAHAWWRMRGGGCGTLRGGARALGWAHGRLGR
eukprot:3602408-Prymnesium_polylepis.1